MSGGGTGWALGPSHAKPFHDSVNYNHRLVWAEGTLKMSWFQTPAIRTVIKAHNYYLLSLQCTYTVTWGKLVVFCILQVKAGFVPLGDVLGVG